MKPGDVVRLKSGGPAMTVSELSPSLDAIECEWFEGANLHGSSFLIDALVAWEEPTTSVRLVSAPSERSDR